MCTYHRNDLSGLWRRELVGEGEKIGAAPLPPPARVVAKEGGGGEVGGGGCGEGGKGVGFGDV